MKRKAKSDRFYHFWFGFFRPIFLLVARIKLGVKAKHPKRYKEPILSCARAARRGIYA